MSFYRKLLVTVAALGLASTVFADDATTPASSGDMNSTTTTTQSAAPADQSSAPADQSSAAAAPTKTTTTTTTTADNSAAPAMGDKVDLNKATAKELMKVKGMGAARAKAIVMYRKKHGDFKSVDDLKEVKGFKKMNEKKMQELSDQLTAG
jgi:competence protein ComEA